MESRTSAAFPETNLPGEASVPAPPAARKIPVRLESHGDVRIDDYFWLRDSILNFLEECASHQAAAAPSLEDARDPSP